MDSGVTRSKETILIVLNRLVPPAEDILRVKRDLDIEGGKIERLL